MNLMYQPMTKNSTNKTYALVCIDNTHEEVDRLYYYLAHDIPNIKLGMRVLVPFGMGNRKTIGCIVDFTDAPPPDFDVKKIKAIISPVESYPVLTKDLLALAWWMKEKYYTTLAHCIRCITPATRKDGMHPKAKASVKKALHTSASEHTLTEEQSYAVQQIITGMASKNPVPFLLHGVTGSGKTEVYLRAIEHVLAQGKQAILLVPEIALTPQIVHVFTERFGDRVAATHSRLTAGERFVIWKKAFDGDIDLIIGPRSAVFSPFQSLGLIVVDEEHEHTYHSEIVPKYDTREIAAERARLTDSAVIFGSATPSLESYYKTTAGYQGAETAYQLLELSERVNKTLPEVNILDMRHELIKGNPSMFSRTFIHELTNVLEGGKQAIIFLNRRGHSSVVSCRWCGHVLTCDACRVNYTYHKENHQLICHYCGDSLAMPKTCPACHSEHLKLLGVGTQKAEEELHKFFPTVKSLRMDMDTTKGKTGHAKILESFRKGEAQVLIGTQMVTKGLNFPNVTLVGVVAADMSLFTGDFRAGEYTFGILTQVAGRAGRHEFPGKVFIQTWNPEHYALTFAKTGDYQSFYEHEMEIRSLMHYPPYSHVFMVLVTGPVEPEVIRTLNKLNAIMEYVNQRDGQKRFEVMGISPAFISKLKNQYRWKILIKATEEDALKKFVLYCIKKLKENDPLKDILITLHLDPMMMD